MSPPRLALLLLLLATAGVAAASVVVASDDDEAEVEKEAGRGRRMPPVMVDDAVACVDDAVTLPSSSVLVALDGGALGPIVSDVSRDKGSLSAA